ncbi:MAG: twin-arginine translocase subunit TatC [Propioniciclava sp.]
MARLSLRWLLPPDVPPGGVMSLGDHLRELRYRLVFSLVVVVVGMAVCAVFYNQLYDFMLQPYERAVAMLAVSNPRLDVQAQLPGVTAPLMLILQVIGLGGLVLTSPVWLYQVWAYLAPALLAKEKKYALSFLGAAVPLFLAGVAAAYWILPQAMVILLGFTPKDQDILNLLNLVEFLTLMMKLMLVFGIGFLMPVIVVALNFMGIVSAAALKKARPYVMFGCAIFGAAATPGGDPFSMLALAIPMMMLFFLAELIARANDRRRAARTAGSDVVPA